MSAPSIAEKERRQLRLAFDPFRMAPYLMARIKEMEPDRSFPNGAVCDILDAKYDPGEGCWVLYRLGDEIVVGMFNWDAADGELASRADAATPLEMAITLFPHDAALPGLESALRPDVMAAALNDVLPECRGGRGRVVQCRVTPIRYRPKRRCTLRLDIRLRDVNGTLAPRTLFGKVYHDVYKATSVYEEMQMLAEATVGGASRLAVAPPAGFIADMLVVLQEPVKGIPLDEFFGRPGETTASQGRRRGQGVVEAAGALAELHGLGVASQRKRPADAELRKMAGRAGGAATVDPDLGNSMEQLVDELSARLDNLAEWGAEEAIIHGDCKPSQFLMHETKTTLLDFDHCGMADPATDVATFLATLRQLRIKHSIKSPRHATAVEQSRWLAGLGNSFLDQYCTLHGDGQDFRLRTVWYEAQALLRKAQRAFARSTRSPLPAALMDEAWRCIGALPSR